MNYYCMSICLLTKNRINMQQVRFFPSMLCLFLFSVLITSCKKTGLIEKNSTDQFHRNPGGQSSSQSYQISKDDYNLLKNAFAKNDRKLIDSVQNAVRARSKQSESSTTARTADLPEETVESDNVSISGDGTDYFYNPLANYNGDYDIDPWGGGVSNKYINFVVMRGFFPRRGNTIKVVVPFTYFESGGGAFKDDNYSGRTVPSLALEGNFLGDVDQNYYLTWNIQNPTRRSNPAYGNSSGGLMETRTVLKSTDGRIKLVSTFKGGLVEVGGEAEAGFTVSSKYNSTTSYDFTATFDITINSFTEPPTIHYNLGGTCNGIQLN
jgi:hypothetical protein